MKPTTHPSSSPLPPAKAPRAFTLMEMMTAIGLLVLVIVGVGLVFGSATRSISLSQVTLETMSNVRAVQSQIERDIAGLDRNGFIVIRSKVSGGRRFDQLAFLANCQFPNRTGTTFTDPFTDRTVANSARIWYGHLVVEPSDGTADQTSPVPIAALPTGSKDQDFILGRQATLLLAEDGGGTANRITTSGITVAAFSGINIAASTVDPGNSEPPAHITSSRLATAGITSGQLMQSIITSVTNSTRAGSPRLEADNFCYRFKTLPNPYATEVAVSGVPSFANAYFRMHPILLPGVPDFAVEWSDGTIYPNGTGGGLDNTPRWYGLGNTKYGSAGTNSTEPTLANGDDYTAIFSFDNKAAWPKALRLRYRVTDPDNRLNGGRDFIQIIRLPD